MDDDDGPSSHTISMRQALAYCREMTMDVGPFVTVSSSTTTGATSTASEHRALRITSPVSAASANDHPCHDERIGVIPAAMEVAHTEIDASFAAVSNEEFFQCSHRPCVWKRGCCDDIPLWFEPAHSAWVDPETKLIRRDWFLATIGADTLVPVRQLMILPPVSSSESVSTHADPTDSLDEQGRATECDIKHMTLRDYIAWMDRRLHPDEPTSSLYLKDWHLPAWLEQHAPLPQPLYEVPSFFPHDILNAFLMRFTTGDYRFVYWGPPGSYTALHSDVLNSYSWSYNVVGAKEWTFYVPDSTSVHKVLQEAGDLMFVPSRWKHSVVNLQETISINHNWVTTDNLPHVWDCIRTELGAVDVELASSWAIDCFEARENMLRGCIGLDVSSYFFMVLTRGCELLNKKTCAPDESAVTTERDNGDLVSMRDALMVLIQDERKTIQLVSRLKATLASELLGDEAIATANEYMKQVRGLFDVSSTKGDTTQ